MNGSPSRRRRLLAVLAAAAVGASAPAARADATPPDDARAIVARAIGYHGGDRYLSFESRFRLCSKSGCVEITARQEGTRYSYLVGDPALGRRVLVTNDRLRRWEGGREVRVRPDEEQRWRDWAMARVAYALLPLRLAEPGIRLTDLGLELWDGRPLRRVRAAPAGAADPNDDLLFWFDPDTGRLEQFAYAVPGRPGGLRFRRGVDYRRVGGILFFDQENLGVDGDHLRVDEIDPQFVAARMAPISTVRLEEIEVDALPAAP